MVGLITIGEAATELGVSAHTLRYYEKAGLLKFVDRTAGNARRYPGEALDLLRLLIKLRETGMPISRMRQYTDLIYEGTETVAARKQILEQHRDSLKSQIEALSHCLEVVDAKLDIYDSGCSMADLGNPKVKRLNQLLSGNQT